jgi:hypothetical protein
MGMAGEVNAALEKGSDSDLADDRRQRKAHAIPDGDGGLCDPYGIDALCSEACKLSLDPLHFSLHR